MKDAAVGIVGAGGWGSALSILLARRGRRVALWAGIFSWLAFSQVQAGVNARPYALAILGVALATAGFVRVCLSGRPGWRVAFVAGGCLAFWAHFVLVLPVVGLAIGYAITPALQSKYRRPAGRLAST